MLFQLSDSPIEPSKHRSSLLGEHSGGYVAFEGWVRNHHLGKAVTELHYEAYSALALKTGTAILESAVDKFSLNAAVCVHRTGRLLPGDLAVYVGVTAAHRSEAFAACRRIIDEIKADVPIWKYEIYADGTSEWVNPAECHCAHDAPSR